MFAHGLVVSFALILQNLTEYGELIPVEFAQCRFRDGNFPFQRGTAEMRRQHTLRIGGSQPIPGRDHRVRKLVDLIFAQPCRGQIKGRVGARLGRQRHVGAQPGQHFVRAPVLGDLETRRNPGLEREPPQQRVAKRVDGLNLQPARCLERTREQPPCLREKFRLGNRVGLTRQFGQTLGKRRVVQHRPLTQQQEQPRLHLGSSCLGIGQAKDLLRLGARQQKPCDAHGQNVGLAGPRIGADPDRAPRLGRLDLLGRGRDAAHSSSSRLHSPTLARWS